MPAAAPPVAPVLSSNQSCIECPEPLLIARRRLQSAGDVALDDCDRGCRGALQIWKLPLLVMSLSISGRAALSLSSPQPLDAPFAGRMSSRCIMPISS
jgi:hypothetical protein